MSDPIVPIGEWTEPASLEEAQQRRHQYTNRASELERQLGADSRMHYGMRMDDRCRQQIIGVLNELRSHSRLTREWMTAEIRISRQKRTDRGDRPPRSRNAAIADIHALYDLFDSVSDYVAHPSEETLGEVHTVYAGTARKLGLAKKSSSGARRSEQST